MARVAAVGEADRRSTLMTVVREVVLLSALFGLYRLGRVVAMHREDVAVDHARLVHRFEAFAHFPSEAALQTEVASRALFQALNVYYVSVHFPLMIAFLAYGVLFRSRADYVWARQLLVVQTALALVVHIAFPLAPPRMFPQWGFTDTMARYGPSAYDSAGGSAVNQFAAMPSLHIGWAFLIAYAVGRTGPRPLALVAGGHALLTVAVVVLTANHWWLDGLAGVALLLVAVLVVGDRPGADGLVVRPLRSLLAVDPSHHGVDRGDGDDDVGDHAALDHRGQRLEVGEGRVAEVGAERHGAAVGDDVGAELAAR